jgi:hypothetical protein
VDDTVSVVLKSMVDETVGDIVVGRSDELEKSVDVDDSVEALVVEV